MFSYLSNENKEMVANTIYYSSVSVIYFGTVSATFIAIPGLIRVFDIPEFLGNILYGLGIVSGISYSRAHFGNNLWESIRVNILDLQPKLSENTAHNRLESEHLSHSNRESIGSKSFLFDLLYLANSLFAYGIILGGYAISTTFIYLGADAAIKTIAPLITNAVLSDTAVATVSMCVAAFTQFCKFSLYGQSQYQSLIHPSFKDTEVNNLRSEEHNAGSISHIARA